MITIETYTDLETAILGYFQAELPDQSYATDDFLGAVARAVALSVWSLQKSIEDSSLNWPPSDKSDDATLEAVCFLLGLPNGAGGYGRLVSQAAYGGTGSIVATPGTIFSTGLQALGPDGQTVFSLVSGVTVPGGGSIAGSFAAVTPGSAGNLQAGSILTWITAPAGAQATVTLATGLANGSDLESAAAALARIYDRLQNPPKGGSAKDWRAWAEAILTVARAYVYPLRSGTGTVDVVCLRAGTGAGRAATSDDLTAVAASFLASRLVSADAGTALAPAISTDLVQVWARVIPAPGYEFDWDDSGGPALVGVYSAGPPATVTVPGGITTELASLITGGSKPRIQIVNTNGPVVLEQVRCTAWNAGTTTITLETPLTGAPVASDPIYAGGPIPAIVGPQILAYIDSLGPSRLSGYADTQDVWDDTVRTEKISQIALSAMDGTKSIVADIVKSASIPQVLLAVNGGSQLAANHQASEGTAPAISVATRIVVRR
jgi:hypothetical protein